MKQIDYSVVASEFISNAFESKSYRKALEDLASNLHKIFRFYARLNKNQDHILSLLASGHRLTARRKVSNVKRAWCPNKF